MFWPILYITYIEINGDKLIKRNASHCDASDAKHGLEATRAVGIAASDKSQRDLFRRHLVCI